MDYVPRFCVLQLREKDRHRLLAARIRRRHSQGFPSERRQQHPYRKPLSGRGCRRMCCPGDTLDSVPYYVSKSVE